MLTSLLKAWRDDWVIGTVNESSDLYITVINSDGLNRLIRLVARMVEFGSMAK